MPFPAVSKYNFKELIKDKERLDWLEENGIVEYPMRDYDIENETIRDRIDAKINPPKRCDVCEGRGWYADGPTDKPQQVQCDSCGRGD